MAKETRLNLVRWTDFARPFVILNAAEDTPIDIGAWDLSFMIKRRNSEADANALLTLTIGEGITINGTFHATLATNTQRAVVVIGADLTEDLPEGVAHWELKRMDTGSKTILAFGVMGIKQGVHDS